MRRFRFIAVAAAALLLSILVWYGLDVKSKTRGDKESWFRMKGVVLSVDDLASVSWPEIAKKYGINTIGTHITPSQVREFIQSARGKEFLEKCVEIVNIPPGSSPVELLFQIE